MTRLLVTAALFGAGFFAAVVVGGWQVALCQNVRSGGEADRCAYLDERGIVLALIAPVVIALVALTPAKLRWVIAAGVAVLVFDAILVWPILPH